MSMIALAWAWSARTGDPLSKLILVALGDHHNESHNIAWPRVAVLAERAEVSVSTARRKLRELEADGWISTVPRYDADGSQIANAYRLNLLKSMPGQIDRGNESMGYPEPVDNYVTPPVNLTGPPCHSCDRAPRSAVTGQEPLLEPKNKKDAHTRDPVENSVDAQASVDNERAAQGAALRALAKSLKSSPQ